MKHLILPCILALALIGCSHSTEPPLSIPSTAKSKLDDIDSLAQTFKQGMRLMSVSSRNVNSGGGASTWQYAYVYPDTTMPPKLYWFHADADGVGFDSISLMGLGSAVITSLWFNRDSALLIAEQNGGAKFRSDNTDYVIVASVGEPLVPDLRTYWNVSYYSNSDNNRFLMFRIDAGTGVVKTYGPD